MKLHRKQVVAGQRSIRVHAVTHITGHQGPVVRVYVVAVDEVESRAVVNSLPQRVIDHLPDLDGAVLFLEDVGERPYRLDRMLTHLELAGWHERISGVLVGELTGCEEKDADYTGLEVMGEIIARWNLPAAAGFPAGHVHRNFTLPFGAPVRMDADRGRLDWSGPVVATSESA